MSLTKRLRKNPVLRFVLLLLVSMMFGCDEDDFSSDKSEIEMCNYDNHKYYVKLHNADDDFIVKEIKVEEGNFLLNKDVCNEFKNVKKDHYYLTIHRDTDGKAIDTSGEFHFKEKEIKRFYIDKHGDIHRI